MDSEKIEKLSLLTELIKLARVDKEVREVEHQFLAAIANQLGVESADFEKLFDEYIDFTPPKDDFNRILQLQRLILVMNIDLEISEKELNQIREVAINMGLNFLAVEEVLSRIHEFPNKVIPPNVLIEIFMRNSN
jgi:uncharacterized tellurite resistance protein B-like protein